jgi:hypothetical protein
MKPRATAGIIKIGEEAEGLGFFKKYSIIGTTPSRIKK